MKILICFGTRPEAVKMAPVCFELKKRNIPHAICVTAQHREMLDQVLEFFKLKPDYDLNLMRDRQSLNELSSRIFSEIDIVFNDFQPDLVLVQGDTTTAFCISMAAFNRQIKVAHVEAGLRTYNKSSPYPEEVNRQLITRIADIHFAPTTNAEKHLLNEGLPKERIAITGNTVVDALELAVIEREEGEDPFNTHLEKEIDSSKKLILVTGHRRENFGEGLRNICEALQELARDENVQIVYPVHLNPNVQKPVMEILGSKTNILLPGPISYPKFLKLMKKAKLIISDSGGIQEEAPSFGIPVLITRDYTERMEGVEEGYAFLVGTKTDLIVNKANELLKSPSDNSKKKNPYGDGKASERIVDFLSSKFQALIF